MAFDVVEGWLAIVGGSTVEWALAVRRTVGALHHCVHGCEWVVSGIENGGVIDKARGDCCSHFHSVTVTAVVVVARAVCTPDVFPRRTVTGILPLPPIVALAHVGVAATAVYVATGLL